MRRAVGVQKAGAMNDEDELRAALQAVVMKIDAAENDAEQSRAEAAELERQRSTQEQELRALRSQMQISLQQSELKSMREQLELQKQVVAGLEKDERQHATRSIPEGDQAAWKAKARGGSARGFALLGFVVIAGSAWWQGQGYEGALCFAALGALFAAPWLVMLLL